MPEASGCWSSATFAMKNSLSMVASLPGITYLGSAFLVALIRSRDVEFSGFLVGAVLIGALILQICCAVGFGVLVKGAAKPLHHVGAVCNLIAFCVAPFVVILSLANFESGL
jgi:hypothetical protein